MNFPPLGKRETESWLKERINTGIASQSDPLTRIYFVITAINDIILCSGTKMFVYIICVKNLLISKTASPEVIKLFHVQLIRSSCSSVLKCKQF